MKLCFTAVMWIWTLRCVEGLLSWSNVFEAKWVIIKKYLEVPRTSCLTWCPTLTPKLTPDLDPTPAGVTSCKWTSCMQMSKNCTFSDYLTDLRYMTFDLMNMRRLLHNINTPSWVQSDSNISFSPWPLTLVNDLWPHEHKKGPILYQ